MKQSRPGLQLLSIFFLLSAIVALLINISVKFNSNLDSSFKSASAESINSAEDNTSNLSESQDEKQSSHFNIIGLINRLIPN